MQLPLVARPHGNRQLFSDHYLDALLPRRPEWPLLTPEDVELMWGTAPPRMPVGQRL